MLEFFKSWIDDKNKRSLIYQLVTLIIVVYIGMFFFNNTVHNLQKAKIASGWDFLTQEAGFPSLVSNTWVLSLALIIVKKLLG